VTWVGRKLHNIRLVERLATSGAEDVYAGIDERLGRGVTVRALDLERVGASARDRFLRRLRVLSQLEHPNLIRVLDYFEEDGTSLVITEPVSGRALDEVLASERSTGRERLALAEQLTAAVAAAHAVSLVHGDLRAEHVVVGGAGEVKLGGFDLVGMDRGVAAGEVASAGAHASSPEQARGEPATAASDVYGLGVLIKRLAGDGAGSALEALTDRMVLPLPWDRPRIDEVGRCLRELGDAPRRLMRRVVVGLAAGSLAAASLLSTAALLHARHSLSRVTQSRREMEAINRFLEEMLAPRDSDDDAETLRVGDVLEEAAAGVDAAFAELPMQRCQVLETLAATFQSLGHPAEAHALLTRALAIRGREQGDRHPEALRSRNALANVLSDLGKHGQAEALHREVVLAMTQELGGQHPDTIAARLNLALDLLGQSEYGEAEALLRRTLRLVEPIESAEPDLAWSIRNGLAIAVHRQGRLVEAAELHRHNLAASRGRRGNEHPRTLAAMVNLAVTVSELGQLEDAEELFREAAEISLRVFGEEHPRYALTLSNLATALLRQGEVGEAEAIHRQVLAINRRVLGSEHPYTVTGCELLARDLIYLERYDEAEVLLGEALAAARRVLGAEHAITLSAMTTLGEAQAATGKYREAERTLREVLALRERLEGVDHPDTLTTTGMLGAVRAELGDLAEGERLLRRAWEGRRQTLGEDHPLTRRSREELMRVLEAEGKPGAER